MSAKKSIFSALALLMFTGNSLSQSMPPPAHSNSPYYVPPGAQSGNGVNNSQPALRWSNRWGAIASDKNGHYGASRDFSTKKLAINGALADCEKEGGSGCKVNISYHNQCAAIAASDGGRTFLQTDAYEDTAKELALERCSSSYGEDSCWIYYSGCSLPVRVQ